MYGQVCEVGQEAIAGVANHVERKLQWPAQVNLLIYFLMLKPEGGNRGIAKLPSLVRLWERVRYPVTAEWYRKAARDYDWACAGGTAEMAVWHQLLEQESLLPEEGPEAEGRLAALLDLVKCVERVRLHHVWTWGMYWQVPKRLLRLI